MGNSEACCCRIFGVRPPPSCCNNQCPGFINCCALTPRKNVMFTGKSEAGKTWLLTKLLGGATTTNKISATKGFNNQIGYFNKDRETVEFWDPSGADGQRVFWRTIYTNVHFDYLIYVLDAAKYESAGAEDKRSEVFLDDRMEIHTLLCEDELRDTKVILYLNFRNGNSSQPDKERYRDEIADHLELFSFQDYDGDDDRHTKVVLKEEDMGGGDVLGQSLVNDDGLLITGVKGAKKTKKVTQSVSIIMDEIELKKFMLLEKEKKRKTY